MSIGAFDQVGADPRRMRDADLDAEVRATSARRLLQNASTPAFAAA
jgi:hypothetical protein